MHWISAEIDTALLGFLGLLVGSFLNVVIHRLPKIMERQWALDCAELSGQAPAEALPTYNLMWPASACPHCGHELRWHENIPVVSYLGLKGRCSACHTGISWRYPLIELATGGLFAWCAWNWGLTAEAAMWCGFCATLLALAAIDWDTTLLPDDLTLPLLWAGLCASALNWIATGVLPSLWGAVAGYVSLWLVYWAFKLATGKEGMGHGDFKLFAALGAWFGWQALIPMILMASLIGAVIGVAMKLFNGLRPGGYVPFGPFLALAGLSAMLFGPDRMMGWVGL